MDFDELIRFMYAASEQIKGGVGEVEYEDSRDDGENFVRITVRKEVVPSEYNSVSNFGKDFDNE